MNEHDYEPVPGLPAPLPSNEAILWQGSPDWEILARRAMRIRLVTGYFAILIVWGIVAGLSDGNTVRDLAISSVRLAALGLVAIGLLGLFAWLVARTTMYTITTRRVVIRFGIALPITIQIPYTTIDAAGSHIWSNGAGDIALSLRPADRIAYLMMWPHVRPWKLTRAQPSLRSVPDAASVAQILGRALAASASQPATAVKIPVQAQTDANIRVPAAA